jgi:hypothetical protein
MVNLQEVAPTLLSETTVSLAANGQTTLYVVPAGKRLVLHSALLVLSANAGTTTVTIGKSTALTDFVGTQSLASLDAQYDAGWIQPVPHATTPLRKSYAAGDIIQIDVGANAGSAGNTVYLFGFLY